MKVRVDKIAPSGEFYFGVQKVVNGQNVITYLLDFTGQTCQGKPFPEGKKQVYFD